jgi:hypothetical protein
MMTEELALALKKLRRNGRKEVVDEAPDKEATKKTLEDERFADMSAKPGMRSKLPAEG